MDSEQLSVRWQDHHDSLVAVFEDLLRSNTLVDCTIAAEGQYLKAHKVVLSACSPYFQLLLKEECDKHPIIILKDVKFRILRAVIDFVYCGEVKICENQLATFLDVAESLQIKGLGSNSREDETDRRNSPTVRKTPTERETSPIPRKRLRRKQASISEGDSRGCSPENTSDQTSNLEFPLRQNLSTDIPSTSTTVAIAATAILNTESNSGSVTLETRNDDFTKGEISRISRLTYPSDETMSPHSVPVVKTEPDTELFHEPKIEFASDTNEEFVDGASVADDMHSTNELNRGNVQEPHSPHQEYSGFTSPYVGNADLPPDNSYLMPRTGHHHSSQDVGAANVETIDIASDDSSFHVSQMEHGNSEGGAVVHRSSALSARYFSAAGASSPPLREAEKIALRHHLVPAFAVVAAAAAAPRLGPPSAGPLPRRPYTCPDCHKAFPRPSDLKRHRRKHTGERPYECAECGRTFKQREHLKSHERVHAGERFRRADVKCELRLHAAGDASTCG